MIGYTFKVNSKSFSTRSEILSDLYLLSSQLYRSLQITLMNIRIVNFDSFSTIYAFDVLLSDKSNLSERDVDVEIVNALNGISVELLKKLDIYLENISKLNCSITRVPKELENPNNLKFNTIKY